MCKSKTKRWRINNFEKYKSYSRESLQKNEKGNIEKGKIRRCTNTNCRLKHNLRSRIYKVLKVNIKSQSTKYLIGIDIELCGQWIDYQMTSEMNWHKIHIDHVKPNNSFVVSKDEELHNAFSWRIMQPLLKIDNLQKDGKFDL